MGKMRTLPCLSLIFLLWILRLCPDMLKILWTTCKIPLKIMAHALLFYPNIAILFLNVNQIGFYKTFYSIFHIHACDLA